MSRASSRVRKRDLARGPVISPDYTYTPPYTGQRGRTYRSAGNYNAALAFLIGGAYLAAMSYAASGEENKAHAGDKVLDNIKDNNTDPFIKEAAKNASMNGRGLIPSTAGNKTAYEKLMSARKRYCEEISSIKPKEKIGISKFRNITSAIYDHQAALSELEKSGAGFSKNEKETLKGIVLHYPKQISVQGAASVLISLQYPLEKPLTADESREIRELMNQSEDLRENYIKDFGRDHYDSLFTKESLNMEDLARVYSAANETIPNDFGKGESLADQQKWDQKDFENLGKSQLGFNITPISYGPLASEFVDDRVAEWESCLNSERTGMGLSGDISLSQEAIDELYPLKTMVPGPIGFWGGVIGPYLINFAIRRYVKRDADWFDVVGPGTNAVVGGCVLDLLDPASFPLRLVLPALLIEVGRKGANKFGK